MRVAVTAGHRRSLHAVALVGGLAARGHDVALVLEVSVLDVPRVRAYLRQWGVRRLAGKVASRAGRGSFGGVGGEVRPLRDRLAAEGLPDSVVAGAEAVGATHVRVRSLDDPAAVDALAAAGVDVAVYAGGGILRPALLDLPTHGWLNAHGGPLPAFRGMNASEWAMFHGVAPAVTVHLVDPGVDTGPVLFERPVEVRADDSIYDVRGRAALVGVDALLDAVDDLEHGRLRPTPQDRAAGRQYFVMAEPLLEVLDRWRPQGRTPRPPA